MAVPLQPPAPVVDAMAAAVTDPGVFASWGLKTKGTATLTAGTVTISTAAVLPGSVIVVTPLAPLVNLGLLSVANVVPGSSFDIRSANVLDGSAVMWAIV
jgi:hypothetical protein